MRTLSLLLAAAAVMTLTGCIEREVARRVECGDLRCDPSETGWCPDCEGCAMIGDGVCEEGDLDFAPECNTDSEEEQVRFCGDGLCDANERGQCHLDCDFGICGDGICSRDYPEEPWCRVDCGLDPSMCGDGVCEVGEDMACSRDCDNGLCGDGDCVGDEATWCEHDCDEVCSGDRPVNCGDGCYPEFTDCTSDVFDCGGREYRCGDADRFANCCHGVFTQCADFAPDCQANETDCDYRAFPCS